MQTDVRSPVTGGSTVRLATFGVDKLIAAYHQQYRCDVRRFFPFSAIELRQCADTGYQFWYPFTCVGDPAFYADLYRRRAQAGRGYADHRWDFDWVVTRLKSPNSLLDVGCGGGAFLKLAKRSGWADSVRGLETSQFGRDLAAVAGFDVVATTVAEHATVASEQYCVVTAFQLLEHLHDVREFMLSCAALLKRGGRLVVSVPNNDSFVGNDPLLALNAPPHHMGRWTPDSLRCLDGQFGLELVDVAIEPLQPNNFGWYRATKERLMLQNRSLVTQKVYYWMGFGRLFSTFIAESAKEIAGHTMLAVFRKS